MDINVFCKISGISDSDSKVLKRKFFGIKKSYKDWHAEISISFNVPRNLSKQFIDDASPIHLSGSLNSKREDKKQKNKI